MGKSCPIKGGGDYHSRSIVAKKSSGNPCGDRPAVAFIGRRLSAKGNFSHPNSFKADRTHFPDVNGHESVVDFSNPINLRIRFSGRPWYVV